MNNKKRRYFATHGSEKMLFDARMGPQAILHNDTIYIVYQANEHGMEAHPHVIAYDRYSKSWSDPVKLGENPVGYDHHFAPILWIDDDDHLHVLFGCHITPGTHLISRRPGAIDKWDKGPRIAETISYPNILRVCNNKWVLFYRALGHLGFWAYRISDNGGYSWGEARRLIDFDQDPREGDDADTWAGTYPTVCSSADGRSLHIGFVYFDERKRMHPFYKIKPRSGTRYNLYYLRLDIQSSSLYTIEGQKLDAPVNRRVADEWCKVLDTGHELSNMPSMTLGRLGEPYFLLPVSYRSPKHSRFHFVARREEEWKVTTLTETNGTWAGCLLKHEGPMEFIAYVVVGTDKNETLYYSGGVVERWRSKDGGMTWQRENSLVPQPGLLFSNPRAVQVPRGGYLKDHIGFFGWKGPGSMESDPSPSRNRGYAYLWHNGEWL